MKQITWHHGLIIFVSSLVFFTNLGAPQLWDRDEPRNAGCAEEMLARGDWVTPIFNDQLRDAKPVMLYWLIMSAYSVFGVNEFAARFWSAVLAVGTVLATYHIGRRLFNARAALWSSLILSTCVMFDVAARAATPDSVLIFFSTTALMIFVLATFKPAGEDDSQSATQPQIRDRYFPASWGAVALMYAVMGLGILAKGPVGLVLPTAVIGMFLLIMRLPARTQKSVSDREGTVPRLAHRVVSVVCCTLRPFAPLHFLRTCWHMRPVTAIVVALLVAAPWYIMVGVRTEGDFLRGFFLREHFGRATTTFENHDGSVLFYPASILAGFFPWSIFIVATVASVVKAIRGDHRWKVGYLFIACWVGVYVGVFSLASTKLPSYITPCYPALALMTGGFIYRWTQGGIDTEKVRPQLAMALLGLIGLVMLVGVPIAARQLLPGTQWLGALGLIPLIGAVVACWYLRRQQLHSAAVAFAVTATALVVGLFGFAATEVSKYQESNVIFSEIREHSSSPTVASYGCLESTWVYYLKQPVTELTLGARASQTGDLTLRERPWHTKPRPDAATFFRDNSEAFVITTRSRLNQLEPQLPPDVEILAEAKYFLKSERLVLLGRKSDSSRTAARQPPRTLQR